MPDFPVAVVHLWGRRVAAVAEDAAGFSEEGFFEYHLYTLGRPATVLQNEQKQVQLLEASGFEIDKRLIFYGDPYYYRGSYGQVVSNQKVGVFLDFENSERNGLGMPLPKGVVRVYKRDHTGALQFIGEDLIDHTPRDEELRIKMGEAFDVVGDRRQMDYCVISSCVSESTWRIDLRNHKDEDVEVMLVEPVGGLAALSALIDDARLLLTNDTGPRHIAVAFGTPAVVLMGPTDPRHTAHLLERQRVLREDVDCSPCQLKVCPIDHRCMTRLSPERAVKAAGELLG